METIRFYERRGLVTQPQRPSDGGYRFYDDQIVERIHFIRQAQELGFSLREIAELLSLRADPEADCGEVRTQAVSKREEVDHKIAQLQKIRSALDELIATCPGDGALCACSIIEAMVGHRATNVLPPSGKRVDQNTTMKGRDVKTTIFKIDGMHCDGCARTVEALVSMEPGVRKATVSFKAGEAQILFDPQASSEDHLAAAIRKVGYSVVACQSM